MRDAKDWTCSRFFHALDRHALVLFSCVLLYVRVFKQLMQLHKAVIQECLNTFPRHRYRILDYS